MELKRLIKILLRWWWLAAIPVVVVAGYVGLTFRSPAVAYQVVMRFAAGSHPAADLSADYDRYYAWLTSEYIANALADLAVTGTFAEAVSFRLATQGLEVAPGAIRGAIASDNAQSVLVIYLTWPDAANAGVVAEAISAELTENGVAYFPQLAAAGNVARRVDAINPVPLPPSLRTQLLGPGLRLALAAAVGVGLIALAHYFDPLVRERDELDRLDVPVLASIPRP